ncbi:unnamed protein product [Aspergillus oryzae]|nr:unnamed protein product [Aspergillus oryzae]
MASPAQPAATMAAFARMVKGQVRSYSAPVDMAIPASKRKFIPSSGSYPKGFVVSGTHVGVKASNTKFPDLALISSETPCSAAAVFTTNKFQAAPVQVSRDIIKTRQGQGIRSVVINSGCANAVTGKGGLEDAVSMGKKVDECDGLNEPSTLVMSTGVIGQRLAGMTKGAGMIHPNMATLLGVLCTDAPIEPSALQSLLKHSVNRSFNSISVDGDTSTNDTIAILANGAAGGAPISSSSSDDYAAMQDILTSFAQSLSQLVVRDGEGATKFVTVRVQNSPDYESGRLIASTIARSPLVKTALYGKDANWGRILCAIGYTQGVAPGTVVPEHTSVSFKPVDGSPVLNLLVNGEPEQVDEERASVILQEEDLEIVVDLGGGEKGEQGLGGEEAVYWFCDFSHDTKLKAVEREDLRHGKEDTSTATKSAKEVRGNGKSTNASTTEGSSSRDNPLELLVHALLTVAGHHKTLILELLGNVTRGGARDFNPGLGEESASNQHEGNVNSGVDRVKKSLLEVERRGHVVSDTGGSVKLGGSLARLPNSEKLDQKVVREARVQHLTDEEDVGAQGGLEHNRHVRGVEETNGVRSTHSTLARGLDGDLHTETLEVDDGGEYEESSQQVHDVREVLAIESLAQSTLLVGPGQQKMEQSDDSTLELGTTASVDGSGRESLPDDRLANVGGNEQRDTASKTVSLLEQLIQKNDNKTSNNQLNNEQDTDTGTKIAWLTIETSQDIDTSLTEGEDDREKLLGGLVQFTVGFEVKVDIDEMGTSEELLNKRTS